MDSNSGQNETCETSAFFATLHSASHSSNHAFHDTHNRASYQNVTKVHGCNIFAIFAIRFDSLQEISLALAIQQRKIAASVDFLVENPKCILSLSTSSSILLLSLSSQVSCHVFQQFHYSVRIIVQWLTISSIDWCKCTSFQVLFWTSLQLQ